MPVGDGLEDRRAGLGQLRSDPLAAEQADHHPVGEAQPIGAADDRLPPPCRRQILPGAHCAVRWTGVHQLPGRGSRPGPVGQQTVDGREADAPLPHPGTRQRRVHRVVTADSIGGHGDVQATGVGAHRGLPHARVHVRAGEHHGRYLQLGELLGEECALKAAEIGLVDDRFAVVRKQ